MGANPRDPKRISAGFRSPIGSVSGFCRGLSLPFPGSFVPLACFVDHPSNGSS
jgi:hypothetical protein